MGFAEVILFLLLLLPLAAANSADKEALLALKSSLISIDSLSTWIDHHPSPCNWTGVTCNPSGGGRVVKLDLSSMNLRGPISPYIGNLSCLTSLQLQRNQFHGPIPDQIGKLSRLKTINVSFNLINGEIPANLSRCSELMHLDLMQNAISGDIPDDLGRLSRLRVMNLARNYLSGTIPLGITNLSSLAELNLGTNNLRDGIPADLAKLRNLRSLDLTINNLTGTVPPAIYNMSSIEFLALASNQLWGEIPIDIGFTLPNLLGLNLCVNDFTGTIPISLHNLTKIESIRMRTMLLHGSVPPGLENLKNLQMYNIASNNIVSYGDDGLSFLTSLTNSTRLQFLSLEGNLLEGKIPESIGNLSKVLSMMFLGGNQIYGRLPESVGDLIRLSLLDLSYNLISGEIPPEIGRLTNLQSLDLSGNMLSGEIPGSFENLENLMKINMSGNELVGSIPIGFRGFKKMSSMDLSRNLLNGSIPKEILRLQSLNTLLNLSKNSFSGILLEDIGKLDNVAAIDLSNNMLSGTIPNSISECKSLEKLLMANNEFTGPIPKSLENLRGLEILDLSSNQLSGTIPSELENLRALKMMNLSFNNLEGRVLEGSFFANTSIVDLQGNPKLCSSSKCGRRKNGGHDRTRLIMVSTMVGVTILLALCFFVVWVLYKRRSRVQDLLVLSKSFKVQRLSYNDIRKATGGFDDENLIGRGGFGSVYKGRIGELGPWIAIKVFDLDRVGAMNTFVAECKSMKNVRHRNLVKLITTCASTDFKNKEFLALVYELMSNGSLTDWITGKRNHANGNKFNVVERLNVAIDVAIAINYLHNECEGQVVHCDLKPNNILLDEEMSAKVGDFGLSKLLGWDNDQHSISISSNFSLRGSIGYIPPEYGMGQKPRVTGDIYSYGITLLELFTGRGPTSDNLVDGCSLKKWVENALTNDEVEEVLDPVLVMDIGNLRNENGVIISVEKERMCFIEVLRIGIGCAVDLVEVRLTIDEVLSKLRNIKKMTFTA